MYQLSVRGLNNQSRQAVLKKWISVNKPFLGGILETHVKEDLDKDILASICPGWRYDSNYSCSDNRRILIITYKKSDQFVPATNSSFNVAFIYAQNLESQKRRLWEDISALRAGSPLSSRPWLPMGDFNQILLASEHYSIFPSVLPLRGMADFETCLVDNELSDLSSRGVFYTWTNNNPESPTLRKLDRAVNDCWRTAFLDSNAFFDSPRESDHAPCLVSLTSEIEVRRKSFKYFSFLSTHPKFLSVLKEAWGEETCVGSDLFVLGQKLKAAKVFCKHLNREGISNIQQRAKEAFSRLENIQKDLLSNLSGQIKDMVVAYYSNLLGSEVADTVPFTGRLLCENVLLASELVENFHKEGVTRRGCLQIDLTKVYENLSWTFVLNILEALDIPPPLVQKLICRLYFHPYKGLRQAMDVLAKKLDMRAINQRFSPHPLGAAPLVTHLSFADGVLVFFYGEERPLSGILNILEDFRVGSGLHINREKSFLYLDGNNSSLASQLAGLRRLADWNKVLGLKHISLIFTVAGCLWISWLRINLLQGRCFWAIDPRNSGSWIWKQCKLRPLARPFVFCEVGSGIKTMFWSENWTGLGPLIDITGSEGPRLTCLPLDAMVADAIRGNEWWLISSRSINSVISLLRQCLPQVDPIMSSECDDSFLWKIANNTSSLSFSASKTWDSLHLSGEIVLWNKAVWFKDHIPKHAFGCWVVARNRMLTRDRLRRWGIMVPSQCLLCNTHDESREHLFFDCPYSNEVWTSFTSAANLSSPAQFDDLLCWIVQPSPDKNINKIVQERNARLHLQVAWPAATIVKEIQH
ncbi:unnamed protein product, partial [Thlaspi arvense]